MTTGTPDPVREALERIQKAIDGRRGTDCGDMWFEAKSLTDLMARIREICRAALSLSPASEAQGEDLAKSGPWFVEEDGDPPDAWGVYRLIEKGMRVTACAYMVSQEKCQVVADALNVFENRAASPVPPRSEPEWVAKLRHDLATYTVPDDTINVPTECVVILRSTVERLLDAASSPLKEKDTR